MEVYLNPRYFILINMFVLYLARGIDIDKLDAVISYDAPGFTNTYVHRYIYNIREWISSKDTDNER